MSVFLKEVVRNKLRLALVIVLVALLSYMAFTLGGMANGLYVGMVQAVQKMEGDLVVVSDRSGGSLTFSRITGDVWTRCKRSTGWKHLPSLTSRRARCWLGANWSTST